ncbi:MULTISPECIES: tetratricopeptide repeat protein [Sphingomonas]|uniref:tetratricopeptide repeat protein n=1 Tax=Sphingomonas TaxID=13687 RepID=UPI0024131D30|nr:tetratricopeptide repeat protein [Sphingomonas echinoides]
MMKFSGFAVAAMVAVSSPALAQDDFNGATQILQGDYASAERIILAQQRMFPTDPDLMLNLAVAYQRTGRTSEARALYRTVLSRPDEPMDMPSATVPRSSHALANAALGRLDGLQYSAR